MLLQEIRRYIPLKFQVGIAGRMLALKISAIVLETYLFNIKKVVEWEINISRFIFFERSNELGEIREIP